MKYHVSGSGIVCDLYSWLALCPCVWPEQQCAGTTLTADSHMLHPDMDDCVGTRICHACVCTRTCHACTAPAGDHNSSESSGSRAQEYLIASWPFSRYSCNRGWFARAAGSVAEFSVLERESLRFIR